MGCGVQKKEMLHNQCVCPELFGGKMGSLGQDCKVVNQNIGVCVCVVGDYNSIRVSSERRGRSEVLNMRDMNKFDGFIRNSNLLDMPIHGRKFTCYKPDGTCKSRLDRVLLNNEWLAMWPSITLKGLVRTVSNHSPPSRNNGSGLGPQTIQIHKCLGFPSTIQEFCREFVEELSN